MRKITFYMIVIAGLCRISVSAQVSCESLGGGAHFTVQTFASDTVNDILYAGGYFVNENEDTIAAIGKWQQEAWQPVGTGIVEGIKVSALVVYNEELIVGGTFSGV